MCSNCTSTTPTRYDTSVANNSGCCRNLWHDGVIRGVVRPVMEGNFLSGALAAVRLRLRLGGEVSVCADIQAISVFTGPRRCMTCIRHDLAGGLLPQTPQEMARSPARGRQGPPARGQKRETLLAGQDNILLLQSPGKIPAGAKKIVDHQGIEPWTTRIRDIDMPSACATTAPTAHPEALGACCDGSWRQIYCIDS